MLITFDDGYADLTESALPVLRRYGFGAAVFVVTGLLGQSNNWDPTSERSSAPGLMNANQVADWARKGIEFGAHGRTHRDLSSLEGRDLNDEVDGSRDDLERITNAPVSCFAYPFGRHSLSARRAVSATYQLAFTAVGGVNSLATPRDLLRRAPVGPTDSVLELEWRAWTGTVPFSRVRDRLQIGRRWQSIRS
jgi:peptidoglycan/xylan/chitin deacetylase (PgdA/CDA1 family)